MVNKNLITLYPTTESNWANENVRTEGALLRDEFAKAALQSLIAQNPYDCIKFSDVVIKAAAKTAYLFADAMLEARGD